MNEQQTKQIKNINNKKKRKITHKGYIFFKAAKKKNQNAATRKFEFYHLSKQFQSKKKESQGIKVLCIL